MAIANTTLRNLVAGEGDTVYKTIVSYPRASTYTPGSDITQSQIVGSRESLTIGTYLASMVIVDDVERSQSIIDLGTNISHKQMMNHNNSIEQQVLAEVTNSIWYLDDGNVGGTAGNNMTINTNVIPQVFVQADVKLDQIDAPKAGRTAVIGGHFLGQLKLQQAARPGSTMADGVNTRGIVTQLFGWDILYSNNLPYTAVLTFGGVVPVANDTLTIVGVTLTYKVTPSVAGDVCVTSTQTQNITNLAAAINAPDTTIANSASAGFVALSAENAFLWADKRRLLATITVASTTITLTGFGDISVKSSFTDAGNVGWSGQRQDSLFCVSGCIDMIVQIPPKVEVSRAPKQFADIVKSMVGFGKKTYADGAREMVWVKINAGTSDWA